MGQAGIRGLQKRGPGALAPDPEGGGPAGRPAEGTLGQNLRVITSDTALAT